MLNMHGFFSLPIIRFPCGKEDTGVILLHNNFVPHSYFGMLMSINVNGRLSW